MLLICSSDIYTTMDTTLKLKDTTKMFLAMDTTEVMDTTKMFLAKDTTKTRWLLPVGA